MKAERWFRAILALTLMLGLVGGLVYALANPQRAEARVSYGCGAKRGLVCDLPGGGCRYAVVDGNLSVLWPPAWLARDAGIQVLEVSKQPRGVCDTITFRTNCLAGVYRNNPALCWATYEDIDHHPGGQWVPVW